MTSLMMFVDIIKAADLGWLATDNDQQSYINDVRKRLHACVSADDGHFSISCEL